MSGYFFTYYGITIIESLNLNMGSDGVEPPEPFDTWSTAMPATPTV